MVRFAPWNPDMNMSEDEYKADVTAKSQAWSRGEWPIKTVQSERPNKSYDITVGAGYSERPSSDTFGRGNNTPRPPVRGGGPRGFGQKWIDRDLITRPTRDLSRRERNKRRRMELLGGGRRREREYPSFAPTSGRNLASREDRMRMLTGESDFGGRGSRYGGREEYDRQDREFNRQFDEAPRGPQPWDSPNKPRGWGDVMDRVKPDRNRGWEREITPGAFRRESPSDNRRSIGGSSPIEGVSGHDFVNNPKYQNALQRFGDTGSTKGWPAIDNVPTRRDQRENTLRDYEKGGDVERMYDEFRGTQQSRPTTDDDPWVLKNFGTTRDPDTLKESVIPGEHWWHRDDLDDWNRKVAQEKNNPQVTPQKTSTSAETNAWGQKPLNAEEIEAFRKKQDSFATAQKNYETRLKALESRGPIVNQPTVDLSGVEGRLSQLEGKGSEWQEDRIAALEGRKPQDLSGIQGRLSELEGKAPSWQEDRIKQLEGGRTESKSARDLLDQRLTSLENYYRNDPPPEESTGNRYEDKLANLNKMWEQQGSTWDQVKDTQRYQGTDDDRKWSRWGQDTWTRDLPDPYVNQLRDLNKEYNKPTRTAIIKGREYKSYGPRADKRLKDLDQWNIHEDEYLGTGTWQNQYGQDVTGWNRGGEDRYFASHSGLDKDSDEYKMRFRGLYPGWEEGQTWAGTSSDKVLKDIKERGYGSGKDYSYY